MKGFSQFARELSQISQLGLSMITPILLCIFLSDWIRKKLELGNWIMIVGILVGVLSAGLSAFKFYRYIIKK